MVAWLLQHQVAGIRPAIRMTVTINEVADFFLSIAGIWPVIFSNQKKMPVLPV
jgi:hypothetical protein